MLNCKRHAILIIADKEGLGNFLESFLKEQGFDVKTISPKRYDKISLPATELKRRTIAILTDNGLSSEHLPDITTEMKDKNPKISCIVLSGCKKIDFWNKLKRHGVDSHLLLPAQPNLLLDRIRKTPLINRMLSFFQEAGLYEVPDDLLEKYCQDNGVSEEEMYELLPNPETGLPMILGIRRSPSFHKKLNQLLQSATSLEELREIKTPEEKIIEGLEVLRSLKDEMRALG